MRKLILIFALNLPLLAQSGRAVETAKGLVIHITRRGTLYLNEKATTINGLVADVQSSAARSVYLRADSETPWEPVAQVISALGAASPPIRVTLATSPSIEKR